MGPFCEFKKFDEFIHRRGDYAKINSFETFLPALKRKFFGWLFILVNLGINLFVLNPNYLKTEEYVNDSRGYLFKAGCVMITIYSMIFMYFGAFLWMEAQ